MIGGGYHAVKQISTYGWETTSGTVLSHRWESGRLPSQPGYFDKAIVLYTYSVSGKSYTNNKIGYGFNFLSIFKFVEKRKFLKYPVGGAVKVYFNERDPKQSVLEKGLSFSVIIEIILGAVLFYLGKTIGRNKT